MERVMGGNAVAAFEQFDQRVRGFDQRLVLVGGEEDREAGVGRRIEKATIFGSVFLALLAVLVLEGEPGWVRISPRGKVCAIVLNRPISRAMICGLRSW
jgi:hypothetical protein